MGVCFFAWLKEGKIFTLFTKHTQRIWGKKKTKNCKQINQKQIKKHIPLFDTCMWYKKCVENTETLQLQHNGKFCRRVKTKLFWFCDCVFPILLEMLSSSVCCLFTNCVYHFALVNSVSSRIVFARFLFGFPVSSFFFFFLNHVCFQIGERFPSFAWVVFIFSFILNGMFDLSKLWRLFLNVLMLL